MQKRIEAVQNSYRKLINDCTNMLIWAAEEDGLAVSLFTLHSGNMSPKPIIEGKIIDYGARSILCFGESCHKANITIQCKHHKNHTWRLTSMDIEPHLTKYDSNTKELTLVLKEKDLSDYA